MPLYEYRCEACGRSLEVIQKFSEDPLTECPDCGGRLERLLSAPAIQFKGSGWYITDYARKSNGDKSAKDSSASEKPGAKKESQSESKAEASQPAKESKSDSGSTGGKTGE